MSNNTTVLSETAITMATSIQLLVGMIWKILKWIVSGDLRCVHEGMPPNSRRLKEKSDFLHRHTRGAQVSIYVCNIKIANNPTLYNGPLPVSVTSDFIKSDEIHGVHSPQYTFYIDQAKVYKILNCRHLFPIEFWVATLHAKDHNFSHQTAQCVAV